MAEGICLLPFSLYIQITAQYLQRVQHAVNVAALIAVAGVNTGANESMTDICAGAQSCLYIGAVEGQQHHNKLFFHKIAIY